MLINQDVVAVKGWNRNDGRPPDPKYIMFHGLEGPENRLVFDADACGRGWDYILDIMLEDLIPFRIRDAVVLFYVRGSCKIWRGWA